MTWKVFIDGEAGTTGLHIQDRLAARADIELVTIEPARRRSVAARAVALNASDAVILCLPDDAAREAVGLIDNPAVKVIDASTAHRVSPGWTYGFAEMTDGQREAVRAARRVSNPGCYATGFIALVRPLVAAGLLPAAWPVSVNAVSGYSGGGRAMIAMFEDPAATGYTQDAFRAYALDLRHKHAPEMRLHALLTHAPLFAPSVGRWRQGMLVEVPLNLWALPTKPSPDDVRAALARAYEGEALVRVAERSLSCGLETLQPEALNGSDLIELHVFGTGDQARLVALFDNLGKGAAGAAVQNLNLMLGSAEHSGLIPEAQKGVTRVARAGAKAQVSSS